MTIENLYAFAKRIEDSLREIDGNDVGKTDRADIAVSIRLPKKDVLALDEELHYALKRLPTSGYVPQDEVYVKIWNIPFEITAKEADTTTERLQSDS